MRFTDRRGINHQRTVNIPFLLHGCFGFIQVISKNNSKNTKVSQDQYDNNQLSISASFGIAALKENAGYIEKTLHIDSLENIYEIEDSFEVDWNKIENNKIKIADVLLKMADMSLYRAKQTVCKKCGFGSQKLHLFINDKCPKCNSIDLIKGRNKFVTFE